VTIALSYPPAPTSVNGVHVSCVDDVNCVHVVYGVHVNHLHFVNDVHVVHAVRFGSSGTCCQ
jgi:hypothetical protein